jgi:Flp pilus assembly protein TadD
MVRNNLAVVLSDTGRRDEALAEFKQVLVLQPAMSVCSIR